MKVLGRLGMLLTLVSLISSCKNKNNTPWTRIDLRSLAPQMDVPRSVLRQFDSVVRGHLINDVGLIKMQVLLTEKTPGVLGTRHFDIDLGRGGGAIDLSDYRSAEIKGDYLVKVKLEPADLNHLYVLFVPQRHSHKVGNVTYGMACDHFVDITKFFHHTMMRGGLRVTDRDGLDTATIVGTYLVAAQDADGWRVAALAIKDGPSVGAACPRSSTLHAAL